MTTTGDGSPGRRLGRRRVANVTGGRPKSHRVLVTIEEHEALKELAKQHKVTVPRLLLESALADSSETPTQRREVLVELFAIRRILGAYSNNVNQLARSSNATQEFRVEATHTLRAVRGVVARIDEAIDGLSSR